jgi:hypothetical protein
MQPKKRSDHVELKLTLEQLEMLQSTFHYMQVTRQDAGGIVNPLKKTQDAIRSMLAFPDEFGGERRSVILTRRERDTVTGALSAYALSEDSTGASGALKLLKQITIRYYSTELLTEELARRGYAVALVKDTRRRHTVARLYRVGTVVTDSEKSKSALTTAPELPEKSDLPA